MRFFNWMKTKRAKKETGNVIWGYSPISSSGAVVNQNTALAVSAVYACCRVLAETLASVPLILYRRLDNGGKERADDHELYPVLHDKPNFFQTSFSFRELLQNHLCLRGNAYAQIIRDRGGRVRELIPLMPERTEPKMGPDMNLFYEYTPASGGQKVLLKQEQVLHVKGLGTESLKGLSILDIARDSIGLSITQDNHAGRFFSNGATPSVIFRHPKALGEVAYNNLRKSLEQKYTGMENANKIMLVEEGMEATPVQITPEQSQMIQARKFQVVDICRWFRVPPHLVGDLDRATFSNIEQQSLEFIIYTMRPWLVRWEQALNMALLSESEQGEYFFEFLIDGLLRGDIASRYAAYAIGRQWGWLNVDEIREMENKNPLDDDKGKTYLEPMNMKPAGTETQPTAPAQIVDKQPAPAQEPDTNA